MHEQLLLVSYLVGGEIYKEESTCLTHKTSPSNSKQVLSVRINKLEFLEPILNCPELGEILVGKNFINNLDFVVPCAATLTVLDCSDNKVCEYYQS